MLLSDLDRKSPGQKFYRLDSLQVRNQQRQPAKEAGVQVVGGGVMVFGESLLRYGSPEQGEKAAQDGRRYIFALEAWSIQAGGVSRRTAKEHKVPFLLLTLPDKQDDPLVDAPLHRHPAAEVGSRLFDGTQLAGLGQVPGNDSEFPFGLALPISRCRNYAAEYRVSLQPSSDPVSDRPWYLSVELIQLNL